MRTNLTLPTITLLGLALLTTTTLAPVTAAQEATGDQACLTPAGATYCAQASGSASLACTTAEEGEITCSPEAGWRYGGLSSLGLPGQASSSAQAVLTTCTGIRCLADMATGQASCTWQPLTHGCQGSDTLALPTVDVSLADGQCATVTLEVRATTTSAPHDGLAPAGAEAEHLESVEEEVCA